MGLTGESSGEPDLGGKGKRWMQRSREMARATSLKVLEGHDDK